MGRKGKLFVAVKKVLSIGSKEKKPSRTKSKKKWKFGKSKLSTTSPTEPSGAPAGDDNNPAATQPSQVQRLPPSISTVLTEIEEIRDFRNDQAKNHLEIGEVRDSGYGRAKSHSEIEEVRDLGNGRAKSHSEIEEVRDLGNGGAKNREASALAHVVVAKQGATNREPSKPVSVVNKNLVDAALATGLVIPPSKPAVVSADGAGSSSTKSREEDAAIKIQSTYRGYLARRALRALRRFDRLKSLISGNAVRCQTSNTLRYMQTLTKVQSQIRSRRIRTSEENQALQKQLQIKHDRDLEKSKIGEDWDDSVQSKEQIEASIASRQEAALRRERALAYAFSRQGRNSSRGPAPTFIDPINPQWGWSSVERWMSMRSNETRTSIDKEPAELVQVKNAGKKVIASVEPAKVVVPSFEPPPSQHSDRPPSSQSVSTPTKSQYVSAVAVSRSASGSGNAKSGSPRGAPTPGSHATDDDPRYGGFMDRPRRPSLAGSPKPVGTGSLPSYMQSTESVRAKSRMHSPVTEKAETPEKAGAVGFAKKRLSLSLDKSGTSGPSPSKPVRRHSGPPKVDGATVAEQATSNG